MIASWTAKLGSAAKADPKKTSVLVMLVVVMGVLWVRQLPGSKPAPAIASASAAARVGAVVPSGGRGLGGDGAHLDRMLAWTRQPVKGIGRNLFAVELGYYPREDRKGVAKQESGGFWEELEKSRSELTDQKIARQVLMQNLQLQAAQIKLQSTMMGLVPQAMVNGEMVGEGGVVTVGPADNRVMFRVLRIEARQMIVEREGIKLAIQMK